jgi:hypothetical protein
MPSFFVKTGTIVTYNTFLPPGSIFRTIFRVTTYMGKLHGPIIEILVPERVCLSCSCKSFGRKKTCKKSADLHHGQGNLQQWNIYTGLNQTSHYYTK